MRRTSHNLGKDIRTVASSVVGVGDSADVYAVEFMNETDQNLEKVFLTKLRKLTPEQQERVAEFVEFLVWLDRKRKGSLSDAPSNLENENDHQS